MEVSGYLVNYFNLNIPERKMAGRGGEVENSTKIRNLFKRHSDLMVPPTYMMIIIETLQLSQSQMMANVLFSREMRAGQPEEESRPSPTENGKTER